MGRSRFYDMLLSEPISTHRIELQVPQEVWYNLPVDYSNLRVFGCPACIHVSEGKLEPRARKCIFMGYGFSVKGYRLWCEKSKKIITSKDVVFDENALVTPIVENTLTNNASTSDDTQEEVEPPNIDETDDDARHKKETIFPAQREKRRIIPQRRIIEECDYVAYASLLLVRWRV